MANKNVSILEQQKSLHIEQNDIGSVDITSVSAQYSITVDLDFDKVIDRLVNAKVIERVSPLSFKHLKEDLYTETEWESYFDNVIDPLFTDVQIEQ